MENNLRSLPIPAVEVPLFGAYLDQALRTLAETRDRPFVYANFISSLDGRIAVPREEGGHLAVPKAITNERDWRLFQELAAQADVILSSGRYLRDWAAGGAQDILQIDDPRFADLRQWRECHGLPTYPDFAIISSSLDFDIPPVLMKSDRRTFVFTDEKADPERIRQLEGQVSRVIVAGKEGVSGRILVERLKELGCRTIYSSAGPKILHMLIADGVLDRLYLTLAPKLLGGKPFSTVLEGELLVPPADMKLSSLYVDQFAFSGNGQLYLAYDFVEED